jgi:hypothetical protein
MPGKRSKRNCDPSRPLAPDAGGIPVAGRNDRACLPGSAGNGGWRVDADGGVPGGDMPGCSNAVRDHSANRERTWHGNRRPGKLEAAEPLRQKPPRVSTGGTGQRRRLRATLEPAWIVAARRRLPCRNPVASNGGVPCTSRLRRQNIPQMVWPMIGRMICAFGADDVFPSGKSSKNDDF